MSEVLVGPEDDEASVAPGDVLVVRLLETSTTGYQWRVAAVEPPALEVESSTLVPPSDSAPGATGIREFRLRANTPGEARVEFELSREWEAAPEQRHVLAVSVE